MARIWASTIPADTSPRSRPARTSMAMAAVAHRGRRRIDLGVDAGRRGSTAPRRERSRRLLFRAPETAGWSRCLPVAEGACTTTHQDRSHRRDPLRDRARDTTRAPFGGCRGCSQRPPAPTKLLHQSLSGNRARSPRKYRACAVFGRGPFARRFELRGRVRADCRVQAVAPALGVPVDVHQRLVDEPLELVSRVRHSCNCRHRVLVEGAVEDGEAIQQRCFRRREEADSSS